MKKYELTQEYINVEDKRLFRIKALKDFADVKVGDLGGYIEKENNLSQSGNCWVYNNARVYDDACISGNVVIKDMTTIRDSTVVLGDVCISGFAKVFGSTLGGSSSQWFGESIW